MLYVVSGFEFYLSSGSNSHRWFARKFLSNMQTYAEIASYPLATSRDSLDYGYVI